MVPGTGFYVHYVKGIHELIFFSMLKINRILLIIFSIALSYALIDGAMCFKKEGRHSYDADGYGYQVEKIKQTNYSYKPLFSLNSFSAFWKGPVITFIYGLVFYLFRFDESILIFNIIAFAIAACSFYIFFIKAFTNYQFIAFVAVLIWIFYLGHLYSYLLTHYYIELFLSLLVSTLSILFVFLAKRNISSLKLFMAGILVGLFLMVRATFIISIGLIVLILFAKNIKKMLIIIFGISLPIFLWTIFIYLKCGQIMFFTLEGGYTLFLGTFVDGDALNAGYLKNNDLFQNIRHTLGKKDCFIQFREYQGLAFSQIINHPYQQIALFFKKAIRFWCVLPQYSWIPRGGVAQLLILFIFFLVGSVKNYSNIVIKICLAWIFGLWLFHSAIYSVSRYNYPILSMFIFISLLGISDVVSGFKYSPKICTLLKKGRQK